MNQYEWTIGEGTMVEESNKEEETVNIGYEALQNELKERGVMLDEGVIIDVTSREEHFPAEQLEAAVKESFARIQSYNVDAVMRVRALVATKMNGLESKREKHRRSSNMYIALDEQILHWAQFSASLSTLIEDL